jgi:hypothetical protein
MDTLPFSIVAVQGLGGNGFGSWRATGGADMWLRDFLPEKAKNSRILIYGYNADLTGPGARSFASISDLAKGLVNDLILARKQESVSEYLHAVAAKCSNSTVLNAGSLFREFST